MDFRSALKKSAILLFAGAALFSFDSADATSKPNSNYDKLVRLCLEKGKPLRDVKYFEVNQQVNGTGRILYFSVKVRTNGEDTILSEGWFGDETWTVTRNGRHLDRLVISDGLEKFDGVPDYFEVYEIDYDLHGTLSVKNYDKPKPSKEVLQNIFDNYVNEMLAKYSRTSI